jgi:hypothetical protein
MNCTFEVPTQIAHPTRVKPFLNHTCLCAGNPYASRAATLNVKMLSGQSCIDSRLARKQYLIKDALITPHASQTIVHRKTAFHFF